MKRSALIEVSLVLAIGWVFGGEIKPAFGKAGDEMFSLKAATITGVKAYEEAPGNLRLEGINSNNWGCVTFPDNGVKNIEVKGTVNIARPGQWYAWTQRNYFPMQFCYATEQPGYDFGIMLRQENRSVFYRILFSTKWNEVALWKEGVPGIDPAAPTLPTGFFAAVKKYELKPGQDYVFAVKAVGNRLQVVLNGKTVLEYEDKVLPLDKGGFGFGIFNGAVVKIRGLAVQKASEAIEIAAQTHPQFRAEKWHDDDVIFDGNEPIARFAHGTALWLVDVKLKPGYRPLTSWPHVFDNVTRSSRMRQIQCPDNSSVLYSFGISNQDIVGQGTVTLVYDAPRDTYCYTVDKSMTFQRNAENYHYYNGSIYYHNTYAYNSMPTTDATLPMSHLSLYTASSSYRMGLVKGADGTPYRWPIHHSPWYRPWTTTLSQWDLAKDMYFIRYPEPVVCPAVEVVSLGEDYRPQANHCCSYWDMHFSFVPLKDGKPVATLKAGDVYREQYKMLGYPRAEADKLFEKSKLAPFLNPEIECPWYVPGLNTFARGGNVEQTAGREIWECGAGVTWDKTVGHNDAFSLKFMDNAMMDPLFGYNDEGMNADEWEISAWVKADQWEGAGVRIGIRRLQAQPQNVFEGSEFVRPKPGEWQKIAYTSKKPVSGNLYFMIQTSGKGVCWVDDVEFRKLKLPDQEKK